VARRHQLVPATRHSNTRLLGAVVPIAGIPEKLRYRPLRLARRPLRVWRHDPTRNTWVL